jgi:hypothetical protein
LLVGAGQPGEQMVTTDSKVVVLVIEGALAEAPELRPVGLTFRHPVQPALPTRLAELVEERRPLVANPLAIGRLALLLRHRPGSW